MKALRQDQLDAIERLRAAMSNGNRRIVMAGPTGYGKTLVMASIVERALDRGKRVLVTVPTLSLVDQTVAAFWSQEIREIGVIQANHVMTDWSKPVQVASVQTLQRRGELPEHDMVLVDEAHVWFQWFEKVLLGEGRQSIPTIGFSATPWTKGLGKYYQQLVVAATTADLIERGVLSPFRVFAPSHPDLTGVRTLAGDYHEGDLDKAMNKAKLVADIVGTWQAKGEDRPTICFAVNRAHAKAISDQFEAAGVPAGYMDCDTPPSDREAIRNRFKRGDIRVVCNVDVIGMGVDWPEIGCVIYARPTRSEMRFVQNLGRALRTAPGKTDALILDHSDTHLRLGFVTDIVHDELHDGKTKATADPGPRLPKECPNCAYLKPPRTARCPACGHVVEHHAKPVPVKGGKLEEMKTSVRSQFVDKRETYGMLLFHAHQHGYKQGWAAQKYRSIYNVFPRGLNDAPLQMPSPALASWIKSTQIAWARSKHNGNNGHNGANGHHKTKDEKIVERAFGGFVPGTLCTAEDLEEFGR